MRLFDRLFTRRRRQPGFVDMTDQVRRRLTPACRELTEAEDRIAKHMGLPTTPRLLLIDEEAAVVLTPGDRIR